MKKVLELFEVIRAYTVMIFWPIHSKRNMAKKLGHRLTWNGWYEYYRRSLDHLNENLDKAHTALETLKATKKWEEELCIRLVEDICYEETNGEFSDEEIQYLSP